MDNNTNPLFDVIDVENLFQAWHPDVRKFTANLNQDCVLNIIKESKVTTFDTSAVQQILNLANTKQCQQILDRILKEKNTTNFINLLKERDTIFPRNINREYSIEKILESTKKDNYHPILFLNLNSIYYIIDGRTRFYCCLFYNLPAKVRVISDFEVKEICSFL